MFYYVCMNKYILCEQSPKFKLISDSIVLAMDSVL